jgi:hypothetical protein
LQHCGWRPRRTPTIPRSPRSSASCRSNTRTSAPGGPRTRSLRPRADASSTNIRSSAT